MSCNLNYGLLFLILALLVIVVVVVILPLARKRKQYLSMGTQWTALLKKYPAFLEKDKDFPINIDFHYSSSTDSNLRKLRDMYDLETIAGQGSEIDRIVNLMSWVYRLAGHANEPKIPSERNAFTLIHLAKVEQRPINCYMKTVILNEVYLSMGFYSRYTHLLPHSNEEQESHFITSVYSHSLGKWILMDPDFGVYVTDKKGNILGVSEIRRRLIGGESMKIIHVGRSALAKLRVNLVNFIEGTDYRWYLSKNIFKIRCPKNSMFNQESEPVRVHYELIPDGYKKELLLDYKMTNRGKKIFYTNHEDLFWQKPLE